MLLPKTPLGKPAEELIYCPFPSHGHASQTQSPADASTGSHSAHISWLEATLTKVSGSTPCNIFTGSQWCTFGMWSMVSHYLSCATGSHCFSGSTWYRNQDDRLMLDEPVHLMAADLSLCLLCPFKRHRPCKYPIMFSIRICLSALHLPHVVNKIHPHLIIRLRYTTAPCYLPMAM